VSADDRYDRQVRFFGAEGQKKITASRVGIVGLGGLGSHVAQQLAYLGVLDFVLVDHDVATKSNLNRLIGATPDDVSAPRPKVEIAERMIMAVQPDAKVTPVPEPVNVKLAERVLSEVNVVFGCLDDDMPRYWLTTHCAHHQIPYFDLASDIADDASTYGGRVIVARGDGCLVCISELDPKAMARAQMTEEQRAADDTIYGVHREHLDERGPSVVSLNGVVASLAVTEWMVSVTGLREPIRHVAYYANQGGVRIVHDDPGPACPFCTAWIGESEPPTARAPESRGPSRDKPR